MYEWDKDAEMMIEKSSKSVAALKRAAYTKRVLCIIFIILEILAILILLVRKIIN